MCCLDFPGNPRDRSEPQLPASLPVTPNGPMVPWRRKNDNGNIKDEEQNLGGQAARLARRPTQVGVLVVLL